MGKFKLKINVKLVMLTVFLVAIPAVAISVVGYRAAESAVFGGIKDRLQDQSKDWRLLVDAYSRDITYQEDKAKETAKGLVTELTDDVYVQVMKAMPEGEVSGGAKEVLLNKLAKIPVGKTGYIWILDYDGKYVLSKDRARDGEDVSMVKDAKGNMVIQNLVAEGRKALGKDYTYYSYPWLNKGETESREKIAAMIHLPKMEWVIGVSSYHDEFVDLKFKAETIESIKNLVARQRIGATGYIWVVDSSGKYVISKDRKRDGEDISQSKDANGVLFIQEAVKKAKAAGAEGSDVIEYPWKNAGENQSRMKVAGLTYFEGWDWVIGVSAYYDDFQGGGSLNNVKNALMVATIVSVVVGALLALFVANKISSPLKLMSQAGQRIADGDLTAEIPDVKTGDEVEDIGQTMQMLVGAIKFLKTKK